MKKTIVALLLVLVCACTVFAAAANEQKADLTKVRIAIHSNEGGASLDASVFHCLLKQFLTVCTVYDDPSEIVHALYDLHDPSIPDP